MPPVRRDLRPRERRIVIAQTGSWRQPDSVEECRHSWVAEVQRRNRQVSRRSSSRRTPAAPSTSRRSPLPFRHSGSTEAPRSADGRLHPGTIRRRLDRLVVVRLCRWHTAGTPGPPCRSRHSRSSVVEVTRSTRHCRDNEPASAHTIFRL